MVSVLFLVCFAGTALADWGGGNDRVLLRDVPTITLYKGRMTQGRRSAPVPQLKCMGGTAGCNAFIPQVVQCYNKGSDGFDVQWKCETDMDNAYRFGRITVSCEGYTHPDDPYILRGSCGLEYTIDLTKEGEHAKKGSSYYPSGGSQPRQQQPYTGPVRSSGLGDILLLVVVALVIYALYHTCLRSDRVGQTSPTGDDYPGGTYPGNTNPRRASAPPPPGFHPNYTGFDSAASGGSCASGASAGAAGGGSGGAGGFWTGAATGGILGYMFGSRNASGSSTAYQRSAPYYERTPEYTGSADAFGGFQGRSSSPDRSSGTRTASGYGGTSRR